MTMTPERFHQLLDAGDGRTPRPRCPWPPSLSAGRARLRRRRTAAGAGAALAVVLAAGGVGLGLRGGDDRSVDPISPDGADRGALPAPRCRRRSSRTPES